jgi:hypothetical protein
MPSKDCNTECCKEWKKNPSVNPLTGRKIQKGKGVYLQLQSQCESVKARKAKSKSKTKSAKRISSKSPSSTSGWSRTKHLMRDCKSPRRWTSANKAKGIAKGYCEEPSRAKSPAKATKAKPKSPAKATKVVQAVQAVKVVKAKEENYDAGFIKLVSEVWPGKEDFITKKEIDLSKKLVKQFAEKFFKAAKRAGGSYFKALELTLADPKLGDDDDIFRLAASESIKNFIPFSSSILSSIVEKNAHSIQNLSESVLLTQLGRAVDYLLAEVAELAGNVHDQDKKQSMEKCMKKAIKIDTALNRLFSV